MINVMVFIGLTAFLMLLLGDLMWAIVVVLGLLMWVGGESK